MKRQKRNRLTRAQSRGYHAATIGRSSNDCPFTKLDFREKWLCGWREARAVMSSGYVY